MVTNTLLCPHWAPMHAGGQDDKFIRELAPPVIKLFFSGETARRADVALEAAQLLVVLRNYEISENLKWGGRGLRDRQHALEIADRHADEWWRILSKNSLWDDKLAVEGLNEPMIWANEPPELVAAYYARLAQRLAAAQIRVVALNLGVGWPGNGQPQEPPDSPPIWKPFVEAIEAIWKHKGFLGLHEYWYVNGPQENWGWWAGRFRACPWNVPIIITECGIDSHVVPGGDYYGWQGMGRSDKAQAYFAQLVAYEGQLVADGRVIGATIFTYDFEDNRWATYCTRPVEFTSLWLEHAYKVRNGLYQHNPPQPWPLPKYAKPPWKPDKPAGVPLVTHLWPAVQPQPQPQPQPTPQPQPQEIWGSVEITRWRELCEKYGKQYNIDPRVIGTIIAIESAGNPNAVSTVGAVGLMQVMPREAGSQFADRPTKQELLDPDTNIKTGTSILAGAIAANNGELLRGLAAYYGGNTAAQNLKSNAAQVYISTYVRHWLRLWGTIPQLGKTINAETVTAARWWSEEATRKIEEALKTIEFIREAHRQLIQEVTPRLYEIEEASR